MWQDWLGNTKPKQAFKLILNIFKKLLQNFKKKTLFNGIFYCLPACLPACLALPACLPKVHQQ